MATDKNNLTEKNYAAVYNTTTKPKKAKRRDKSDLGPDFVAPDGGWGWVVCIAAGIANFSIFPALQQYGLIYRQRMTSLGFQPKETTTIVNVVLALSTAVGIVNGAVFRRFTFRQVAMTGAILVFLGIFASAFCTTFTGYVLSLSCLYGIGLGLCMAANSLAVNTYFKNSRRRATGFTWTITGLGPIIFPHVSTLLLVHYGSRAAILTYAAIGLNAFTCALTLQPVLWHVKKPEKVKNEDEADDTPLSNDNTTLSMGDDSEYECKYCQSQKKAKRSIFSSQYLFNEDDAEKPGYEITEPATPMMARANDGWYGSKMSLASELGSRLRLNRIRKESTPKSIDESETLVNGEPGEENSALQKPNYFNREREDVDRYASKTSVYSKTDLDLHHCTCAEEKALMQTISNEEKQLAEQQLKAAIAADEAAKSKMSFKQKVVKFFDLDLLKDFTFVNLALGMTIMMFGEMNFSVLTPFILNSYGYTDSQISLAMSLLGGVDIIVRFSAPLCLEKVKLNNQFLFAFGIIAITIGRFVVTVTSSYNGILAMFVLIGFGKGFRTIFSPLIIPSYVPLKRLPAASGIQLMFNTFFIIICGPLLGIITNAYNYTVTIHVINTLTTLSLLMWLIESIIRRTLSKKAKNASVEQK